MSNVLYTTNKDHKYFKDLSDTSGIKMVKIVAIARKALEKELKENPGFLFQIAAQQQNSEPERAAS